MGPTPEDGNKLSAPKGRGFPHCPFNAFENGCESERAAVRTFIISGPNPPPKLRIGPTVDAAWSVH